MEAKEEKKKRGRETRWKIKRGAEEKENQIKKNKNRKERRKSIKKEKIIGKIKAK